MTAMDSARKQDGAASPEAEGADILLVEDNPSYVELTLRALRELAKDRVRIDIAEDGERALTMLLAPGSARKPRLIILDIKLPKVGGIEVLRQLRADERTKDLPVVVFTSSPEESDRVESYRLGANDYVVKPVGFTAFMEAVANIYRNWMKQLLVD